MNIDRFKFRVWCEADNEMTYPNSPDIDGELRASLFLAEYLQAVWENDLDEGIVLMACTGLKDSEGALIWEGDVLEDGSYGFTEVQVVWLPRGWGIKAKSAPSGDIGTWHIQILDLSTVKVLGSIYENPELLEAPCPK